MKINSKKAVFIIPYFGKLPYYFDLWKKTAGNKKKFDFIIYTDDLNVNSEYNNIKIEYSSFADFVLKVQSKFDFDINIHSARKLCDLKPMYGYIFENEIESYDYWGYCDIDLIFGDIDLLVPLEDEYDKLYAHGHMTLFKNDYRINRIFMTVVNGYKNYVDVLKNENNVVFDEVSNDININLISNYLNLKIYIDYRIADINPYFYNFQITSYDYSISLKKDRVVSIAKHQKRIGLYEDGCLYLYSIIDGKLEREAIRYLHFQKRDLKILDINDTRLLIIPNRILKYNNEITTSIVKKYSKNHFFYLKYYILKLKNLRNKLRG